MSGDMTRVEKPWGYELHWAKTDRYVGKLIHVKAGHALSGFAAVDPLRREQRRDAQHTQQSKPLGLPVVAALQCPGDADHAKHIVATLPFREMHPGERVHITPKTIHRMTAVEDSDIFEVSTPELDDVVRLEDRYGRANRR